MSNISTVKSALEAEIQYAKQGIAFYAARIVAIEHIIIQLDELRADAGAPSITATAKRGKAHSASLPTASDVARSIKPSKAAKGAKSARASVLPKTGNAFWQSLLSITPMSNRELLDAAITSLQIRPTTNDLQKLKQRLANAITNMTKDGAMHSAGSGRERRFTSAPNNGG